MDAKEVVTVYVCVIGAPVVFGKVTTGFAAVVEESPMEGDQEYTFNGFGVAPIVTPVDEQVVASIPALDTA